MDKDEKIKELEEELQATKEHLKKYTASSYSAIRHYNLVNLFFTDILFRFKS